jgi:hypothetical protein
MTLSTHTLGSLNLLDGTKYICVFEGEQGWDPAFKLNVVGLGSTDGARLGSARIGATRRAFQIVALGADYNASRTNADAIDAELIKARNWPRTGALITYVEQDTSESTPDTWKVLGGVLKRTNAIRPAGIVEGVLTLTLSKS